MRSIRLDHSARIAVDEYKLYMFWAVVILAVMLALRVVISIFVPEARVVEVRPATFLRGFSQGFALVVGIINGVYAIRYFVRQGVTRRSFVLGGVFAGIGIAVSLQALAFVVSVAAGMLEPFLPVRVLSGGTGQVVGPFAGIVISVAFFVMGWIIGFSFCRFRALIGIATIFAGMLVLGVLVSIWGDAVRFNVMGITIPPIDGLSLAMSLFATAVLLAGQLCALYLIVKDAPISVQ